VANWLIQPLGTQHQRDTFTCGKPLLDEFIRLRVSQYEKRRLGKTFVAVRPDETQVVGYYTLTASAIAFEHLPTELAKKLPKHPVPVILLARLAIDQSVKGQRLGEHLLLDAFARCVELSEKLGVYAVEVDALDDSASRFYRKYGFVPLLDNPLHLFLPISTITAALK
jgi:predicted GNAT family N-acyltransferase